MTLSRIKIGEDFDFLAGAGEMGQLIREHDWSAHPLGKPDAWPRSLKTAVSLILNSQHPMWIGWGPEMSFLYNDAYIHGVLGLAKHPWALGRPASEVWAEIWDVCGPIRDTGVGIPKDELPRLFERFHRIAGQQSRSYEGSGIGLALVQELTLGR